MCYQALRKLLNNQAKEMIISYQNLPPRKKKDQNKAKTIPNYTDNKREIQNLMRKDREGTSFLLL